MDRQNCRAIMAKLLVSDEDAFAELLAQKTGQLHQQERSHANAELQKALCRMEDVTRLYERLYEDNVSGKVTDEWFLQLSHKYEVESMDLILVFNKTVKTVLFGCCFSSQRRSRKKT